MDPDDPRCPHEGGSGALCADCQAAVKALLSKDSARKNGDGGSGRSAGKK